MKVSVKTLDSRTTQFNVEPETTILQFKTIISPQIKIDVDKIRLIFKGRVLDDSSTVLSCGLSDATAHAVERLPPPPPETTNTEQADSGQSNQNVGTSAFGYIVGDFEPNSQNIPHFIRRIMGNITPQRLEQSRTEIPASRISLAENFLSHAERELITHFLNNESIPENFRFRTDYLDESDYPDAGDNNNFQRLATLLRRLSRFFRTSLPIINAYVHFLEMASNSNSSTSAADNLYPHVPDTAANVIHSLSHACHIISGILVYGRGRNRSSSSSSQFRLVVPRQQYTSSDHSRLIHASRGGASTTSQRNDSTVPQPGGEESSAPVRNDLDPSSIQVTVQVSTLNEDLDSSTSQSESQNQSSHFSYNGSNPTATANVSSDAPRLIRTTAGSSNSSSGQNRTSGQPNSRHRTRSTGRLHWDRTNGDAPSDPRLPCDSIFSRPPSHPSYQAYFQVPSNIPPPTGQAPTGHPPMRLLLSTHSDRRGTLPPFVRRSSRISTPTHVRSTNTMPSGAFGQTPTIQQPANIENWSTAFDPSAVPTIQSDVNRQINNRKQPPFSDGYVCGTPDKKKKLAEQSSATEFANSLSDSFLKFVPPESVDVISLREVIEEDINLQSSYRNNVIDSVKQATNKYEKINPDKFPLCYNLSSKK